MTTMLRYTVLFVLPLLKTATAQFTPAVSVTCTVAPAYTVSLTSGSTTGVIFIDGQCVAQSTAATGSYTFDAAACTTGTVPALGTEFKLVVQEYSTINLATDYIVKVTCNLDTTSVTEVVNLGASGEDFDVTDGTPTVAPTFTVDFQDNTGTTITTGNVGDSVQIAMSIPANEAAVFDYQITTMTVAATDSVDMISAGCAQFASIVSQPSAQSGGALTIAFNLFIPKDTSSSPSLPGTTSTAVTYTFVIEPTCSKRRKRSADNTTSMTNDPVEIELAASLVVFPAGHKKVEHMSTPDKQNQNEANVCLSKTPLIGVLVAVSVTLLICMGITAWMFCRMRKPATKSDMSVYSNSGFKH